MPYVRQPENLVPGQPLFFATAMPLSGSAIGLLVESHEGRPTKIEGNPDHPASLGATDAFPQAAVLQLYDPDRSTVIAFLGEIRPWATFVQVIGQAVRQRQAVQGAGLRFLTETVVSPTLAGQLQEAAHGAARRRSGTSRSRSTATTRSRARGSRSARRRDHVSIRERRRRRRRSDADFLGAGPGSRPIRARLRRTAAACARRRPR